MRKRVRQKKNEPKGLFFFDIKNFLCYNIYRKNKKEVGTS